MANISKLHRDDLLNKISQIRKFIEKSSRDENSAKLLRYLNEIAKDVKGKKYGLIFEEHREAIDELLETHIPVLVEEEKLAIDNGGEQNFLIEGDNLAALKLLEKTHKGKIDVIYIDPPYNTGKTFIYNDHIIGDDDAFKHSKYASFVNERISIAKKLLSPNGIMFISVDDKEQSTMRLVCDEIFSESHFLTTIGWEKRTKCQNTKTAKKMLQPKIEYILVYKNTSSRIEFNCHVIGQKEYPEKDETGIYRIEEIGQMGKSGVRGRASMIFPILGISPNEGNQWKLGKDTILELIERKDLFKKNGKVYRKVRPGDESFDSIKPFWSLFFAEQFGTAESAKRELDSILNKKDHGFETVKPTQMIEELIFQASNDNSIILDFFAGSGTTAQSVLETNVDYGGKRKFIVCTNNENNICRDITYQRLKTVITGKRKDKTKYSGGLPGSLKYFRIDYVPISEKLYYEYADDLLLHIRELVELENGINLNNNTEIAIILTDEEMADFVENNKKKKNLEIKKIYYGHNVLLSGSQAAFMKEHNIKLNVIPDYYYQELEK